LYLDSHSSQRWQKFIEFPKPDQWFTSYDGKMNWAETADSAENSLHEFASTEIAQLLQTHAIADVIEIVCVATGAAQGTFLRDFNGKQGALATQDAPPGGKNINDFHASSLEVSDACGAGISGA
jgi:hypothetical protein